MLLVPAGPDDEVAPHQGPECPLRSAHVWMMELGHQIDAIRRLIMNLMVLDDDVVNWADYGAGEVLQTDMHRDRFQVEGSSQDRTNTAGIWAVGLLAEAAEPRDLVENS